MKKIKLALFGLVAFGSMPVYSDQGTFSLALPRSVISQFGVVNPPHNFWNTLGEDKEAMVLAGAAIVFGVLGLYLSKKAWFE